VSENDPGRKRKKDAADGAPASDDAETRPVGDLAETRVAPRRPENDPEPGSDGGRDREFADETRLDPESDRTRSLADDPPDTTWNGPTEEQRTVALNQSPVEDENEPGDSDNGEATRVLGQPADSAISTTERIGERPEPDHPTAPDRTERLDTSAGAPGATEVMPDATRRAGPAPTAPSAGDATQGAAQRSGISLSVGSVLRNRFRITGTLGEGGMGAVFSAVDMLKEEAKDENIDVALKVMKADIVDASMSFMGLQREARRAQQLAHPNIVTVYDFDRADGVIYMTMEYLRGKPLDAVLEDNPHGLDLETARDITTQICKGLAYAHKEGIVHADLKPQNVFVLESGRAKVLDFGIARAYQAKKVDVVESVFSGYSPPFASPEVMARKNPAPSDDIYALGCVVYQIFTGRHPFNWTPAPKAQEQGLKPARDGSFKRAEWAAVSAALNFDGAKRPADAGEFLKRFAPSRVRQVALGVSLASVLAAGAFITFYDPPAGPETPFEELPVTLQQEITRNLDDAEQFLSFGDLDSAMQLFDAVLTTHPGNLAATDGMDRAAREAVRRVSQALQSGDTSPERARLTLESILEYESLPVDTRKVLEAEIDSL
jgi:predicted Ser/Thr protein kinase